MTSFSERFAKLKPTGVERPKLEPKHVQVKDDFKGLGFTKREAERTQREIERQEKKTLEKPDELFQDQKLEQFENSIETTMRQIAEEARKVNFDYDESQERAIRGILQNRVSVLIGAAGTGKTTITKMIWELLAKQVKVIDLRTTYFQSEYHDLGGGERETVRKLASEFKGEPELAPAICGSAFTGRASQQFKRAMPEKWWSSISTTHKLLGYAPVFEDIEDYNPVTKEWYTRTRRIFKPSFGQDCKLPYVVYIIDEGSMEPILLYNELVDAMPKNARVLIIGDINQLPPVMGKSVLGYAMRKWPVFELTTIHRQAADNPIIANAHRILQGIRPVPTDQTPMISDNGKYGGAAEFQMHVRRVMKYLFDQGIYQPYRDAIVVANSKEELPLSYQAFNLHFAMMFNPGVVRINIHTGTTHSSYGIGDKVMIHSNINDVEPPITNGMTGVVESINLNGEYNFKKSQFHAGDDDNDDNDDEIDFDLEAPEMSIDLGDDEDEKGNEKLDQRQASHVMTIRFDNGQTYLCSNAGDYRRVTFGYAVTCHKMQGGEVPNVFIVVHSAMGQVIGREWYYTAYTRGRQKTYTIFNERGIKMALKNQKIKGITKEEKIQSYVIESKTDDMVISNDPWNVDRTKFPILFNPEIVNQNSTNGAGK